MEEAIDIGKEGENVAAEYLVANGYLILERNWRYKHKEIDIIAKFTDTKSNSVKKKEVLVVVEVKSRSGNFIEHPYTAITRTKQRFVIEATNKYIEKFDIDMDVRFDIMAVIFNNKRHKIEHVEDAFYPLV